MGNSRSFQGYEDVIKIFETALRTGAVAFNKPTEGAAIKFLTRAGSYRRMIRREMGHCAYDTLCLSRQGNTITITRWVDTIPQLFDPRTGAPIELINEPTPYEQTAPYLPTTRPEQPWDERTQALWDEAQTFGLTRPRPYDANAAGHHQLPDDWSSPEPNEPYPKPVDNSKKS